jgi:hypothetical protein
LPEKDQLFESGVAIVSGWGSLHSGGSLTDKLQVSFSQKFWKTGKVWNFDILN